MTWRGELWEAFLDDDGAFSMGRLIALLGALQGAELVQVGITLAIIRPTLGTGVALAGIGAGFFTGGALLKFGQKAQEARSLPPLTQGGPPSPPPGA